MIKSISLQWTVELSLVFVSHKVCMSLCNYALVTTAAYKVLNNGPGQ